MLGENMSMFSLKSSFVLVFFSVFMLLFHVMVMYVSILFADTDTSPVEEGTKPETSFGAFGVKG